MEAGRLVESGEAFKVDMQKMEQKIDEDNRKISNSKVEAFFKRFPFLSKYAKKDRVSGIAVLRIKEELLSEYRYCSCTFKTHNDFLLLDETGEKLTHVGEILEPKSFWWLPAPRSQNIGEALHYLENIGKIQKAKFVLSIRSCRGEIILFAPPRGFTISGWLDEQVRVASEKLTSQLEKIDSEAKE